MLEPGTLVFERYQIVRLVGRGGMGAVYEAVDQRLHNTVALKQMIGGGAEQIDAFAHEARVLAALRHPALPKVIDYFSDGLGRFLVMEFFSGADLAALHARRGGPFPVADVLDWADQLLAALDYLHGRRPPIVHRDIKPQNLKLTPEGQVALLDFGLSKGAQPADATSFFGYTLQYAPLEQIEGSGTEARSDLYALAATLYHMLSERAPPNAPVRADALLAGRPDPLRPLDQLNPEVAPPLAAVLGRALAIHREARPASAAELRAELRELAFAAAHTVVSLPAAPAPAPPAPARERPISIGWEQVRAAANAQLDQVLRKLEGGPRRPGPFLPDAYVERAAAEAELDAFLAGPGGALIVTGDSGVGKTCLLARWAAGLRDAGDAVLFFRCGGSLGPEIDREIARDLGREAPELLLHDLGQIAHLAAAARRRLVIVFDALNEYRSGAAAGPAALLKQIDALVGRAAGPHLRVVLSCNSATWGQLERAGAAGLFWSAYHQTADGEPLLRLGPFSPPEFHAAYGRYAALFQLQTPLEKLPPALAERLRRPLLLRLLAESSREGPVATPVGGLSLGLFRRFYEDRVRQRREQLFLDELAAELLARAETAAPLGELARNERLRPELLSDDPDSAYVRLLDAGVLAELAGDAFTGELASFAYAELGAFVLARQLLRTVGPGGLAGALGLLMARARRFPLAWEVARSALLIARRPESFAELARSPDLELRELVAQSLVELHADEKAAASELIKALCQQDSEEARRTGLKAAYYIGPPARDIFLWAATRGGPALRRAARDTLYLIWRADPGFTYGLLRELVGRIGPASLRDLRATLEFFFELSVTIYINHCERDDVRDFTVEVYYELAKQRLHLDIINTGLFGKTIEDLIFQAVASAFSQPILDTILMAEVAPVEQFFALPAAERALLVRAAPLFEPAVPLASLRPELEALLRSENLIFSLTGMAQIAIHAAHDLPAAEPLLRELFDGLDGAGRLKLLLSFSVLLPGTPPAWAPLLEGLTERMFAGHPGVVYGEEPSLLQQLGDLLLLPLGLAYGKVGQTMPLFELMLQDGLLRDDRRQVERVVAGLAAVGFYHPTPVLRLLGDVLTAAPEAPPAALVATLATIRTLHQDAVDVLIARHGLGDALQREVAAAADAELVRRFIYWLGLYNQVVHSCLFYPKMRRQMAMGAMEMLAGARAPQEFIGAYTATVFRMLREAGFRLSEWTT